MFLQSKARCWTPSLLFRFINCGAVSDHLLFHCFNDTTAVGGIYLARLIEMAGNRLYLIQPLPHQTLPPHRLHNLKHQIALFRETHLQLEIARLPPETPGGHRGGREVEDLERADPEAEEAVHGFDVVGGDDTDFGDGAEEGGGGGGHGGFWGLGVGEGWGCGRGVVG